MWKSGLGNLTLIEHIEAKRNKERKRVTYLMNLCSLIADQGVAVTLKRKTLSHTMASKLWRPC